MKNPPKLTLLQQGILTKDSSKASRSIELLSFEELTIEQQNNVYRDFDNSYIQGSILAVARFEKNNKFSPVIVSNRENSPSLIRYVDNSENYLTILAEKYSQLNRLEDSEANYFALNWGISTNRFWYRKPLVDNTISHLLEENSIDCYQALNIALSLATAIDRLHKNNIIHGHVCSANCYYDGEKVYLMDLAIAHLLVKSEKNLFQYDLNSFAPEVLNGITFEAKSDIYGLGLVLKELVTAVLKNKSHDVNTATALKTLDELASLVLTLDPFKRPSLEIVRATLRNLMLELDIETSASSRVSISKGLKVSEFLLQEKNIQNAKSQREIKQDAIVVENKPENIEAETEIKLPTKRESKVPVALVFLSGIFLFFLWQYRINSMNNYIPFDNGDYEKYAADWNSKIPSRMLPVALAALDINKPDKAAETVIIASSRKDETSISGINNTLIKLAFNDKWEMDLTPQDRRAALVLGLGTLLKNKKIENLPELVNLHPAVIMAIISSINSKSEAPPQYLQNIPASKLLSLPKNYSQGIKVLLDNNPNLNCGDREIQELIYFIVRGIDIDQLNSFLRSNTKIKLQALNDSFLNDENKAQLILELILRNTLLANIQDNTVEWAKAFNLLDWAELKATEKLNLLSGRIPKSIIAEQNVVKLVTHPALIIRSYAFSLIPTAMKLEHPASLEILQKLQNNPDILTPEQNLQLFRILVNPNKIDPLEIKKWIDSNPSMEILELMLVTTSNEIEATPVDTAVASALKDKSWAPNIDVIRKLITHPDKFTRIYIYNLIFNLKDKDTAKEFLKIANSKEKDPDYKIQLEQMINNLN